MQNTSRYLVLALSTLAGCVDITVPNDFASCLMDCYATGGAGGSSGLGVGMGPYDRHIIRGDTVRFVTFRCGAYDFDCYERGSVYSFWSIEGNAAAPAFGSDSIIGTRAAATEIIVRGETAGVSRITAVTRDDSTRSFSSVLTVADSSAITELNLVRPGTSDTVTTAMGVILYAQLLDATRTLYNGQSVTWTINDSTVATPRHVKYGSDPALFFKPPKPGKVVVTATFGRLSQSRQLTFVAP